MAEFARAHRGHLALVGLSNPYRRNGGGVFGQAGRHLRRSGPRLLAYLAVNMALPRLATALTGGEGSLTALCRGWGVPVVRVEDVNGPAFHAALRAAAPDLLLTFHFDQILAPATLALAPEGGINVHPSLLPRHRGPIPTFWAGLEEPPAYGVTVHRLAPRIDAGPILAQRAVELPPGTTASAAARALHRAALPLLEEVLPALANGAAAPRETEPGPYFPFPTGAVLRAARRRGARLLGAADLWAALRSRP